MYLDHGIEKVYLVLGSLWRRTLKIPYGSLVGQVRTYKDPRGANHFSSPGAWREDFGFQGDHMVFRGNKGEISRRQQSMVGIV